MKRLLALAPLLFALTAAQGAETWSCQADGTARIVETRLAGVPAIISIPAAVASRPILLWHGFGSPASEEAVRAALPLDQIPAIKVYLGLPLFGHRAPAEGEPSLGERQIKDYGLLLFGPSAMGAADELPSVVEALRQRQCLEAEGKIDLFGFSASGASVLAALADRKVAIGSAVLINPATGLTGGVAALEKALGRPYEWTPASKALAARSDGIGRAKEIAAGDPPPALLIVTGSADKVVSSDGPRALYDALAPLYQAEGQDSRLKIVELHGLAHDWTDPKIREPVSSIVTGWFQRS